MNTVVFHLVTILNFIRLFVLELPDLLLCGLLFGIGYLTKDNNLKLYARNNAKAVDLRGNAALWGDPQETISSRLGRAYGKERYYWVKLFRIFVDTLFFFDYKLDSNGNKIGHCQKSVDPNIKINEEIWNWSL